MGYEVQFLGDKQIHVGKPLVVKLRRMDIWKCSFLSRKENSVHFKECLILSKVVDE